MSHLGKWAAAGAVAVASVWAGFALTAQEPRSAQNSDAKPVDLAALRDALDTAAKRGGNVDDIRKALAAFEKAAPAVKPGRVPPELQVLRDAVEAAAGKGENVTAIAKELAALETAVAGRPLARPQPAPRPDQRVEVPNPINLNPRMPLPPADFGGGRIDPIAFQKAADLYTKALDLIVNDPNDPNALKLLNESKEMMIKAIGNGAGAVNLADLLAGGGAGGAMFPEFGRVPERARLGVRMEKLTAVTAEQLGLDANVGIAVAGVVPGSAAEKAGLKANDIILEFAGKPVSNDLDDFIRRVNAARANEKFDIVVMRKGKKVDVKGVVLPGADGARPAPAPARPNIQILPPPPGLLPALPKPVPAPLIDAPDVLLRAEAPKVADLEDLLDAVAAAGKRGANVGPIRDALTAFEKAQAKGAAKPGEAPPELTALRAAVEEALQKGENVAAVAKELARVEKAVTGREYERPKPMEEPKLEPVPPLPRPRLGGAGGIGGGFNGGLGGRRIVINAGGDFNSTSITVVNGNFTIKARQGDVTFTIAGTDDGLTAPKIVIKDGDTTTETDDLKKVPEAHLPAVEKLLKMVNRK